MKPTLAISALGLLLSSGLQAEAISPPVWASCSATPSLDSIGLERRSGKLFVLHRVNQGQTLYAIARRYNTSVEVIKAANPDLTDAVQSNQLVRIPQPEPPLSRKEERAAERAARREEKATRKNDKDDEQLMRPAERDTPNADVHLVEPGQTLYSIAAKHKVLMADIRRWNNLTSDNLQAGQRLVVSEKAYAARQRPGAPTPTRPGETRSSETRPDVARPDAPRQDSSRPSTTEASPVVVARPEPKPEAPRKEPTKSETKPEPRPAEPTFQPSGPPDRTETRSETPRPDVARPIRPGDPGNGLPAKGRRMAEIGMAERIDTDGSSNKYLALHRTAPVGSLVQVRNDISNQSLWVKVIGRLPDTGVNERVLIKLSSKAFEKLSPNNQSFRAEVSYLVP